MKSKSHIVGIIGIVVVSLSIATEMFSFVILEMCGMDHIEYFKAHEESSKDSEKLKDLLEDADDKYVESIFGISNDDSAMANAFSELVLNQLNDVEVILPPPEYIVFS